MIYNVTIHDSVQTQSTGFRQTPPDSTGFRQTLPDSTRFRQTPPDSTRLHQILLDSAGLWWTTVCDRMSHYVTNLLLFVTYTGVRRSRWGSVKYCGMYKVTAAFFRFGMYKFTPFLGLQQEALPAYCEDCLFPPSHCRSFHQDSP